MKKLKLSCICLLVILNLVGCENNNSQPQRHIIYNGFIYNAFVDGKNYIYSQAGIPIIQNKVTGKTESFIRNPFFDDKKQQSYVEQIQIDTENNKGYYIDDGQDDNNTGFSIMQFDTKTFETKEIYKENFIHHKKVFLGLTKVSDIKISKGNDFSQARTSDVLKSEIKPKYFVDRDDIYLVRDNGIFRIDMKSKKQVELVNENGINGVSFDGENIYYINNVNEIYKYFINTGKKVKITNNRSEYLMIAKNKIIYTNLNDNNHIYIMNKDGSSNHKIGNNSSKNLNYDDKYIYYSNQDDNQCLYRIKFDGSENKKMTNIPAYFIFTFKNYNKVYIWSNDSKTNEIRNFSVDKSNFVIKLLKN